jgi:hypothetical protein
MKRLVVSVVAALMLVGGVLLGQAAHPAKAGKFKPCEELKKEIQAKLEAKGVKGYTLEIVAPDKTGDRKVVGSCDGGTRRIVYTRK